MKRILLVSAITLMAISSCKKKGCMDVNAKNYNAEAQKDDETCVYEGNVMFWTHAGDNTELQLVKSVMSLDIYVDDEMIGELSTNYIGTEAPACEDAYLDHTFYLGFDNSKIFNYEAKGDVALAGGGTEEQVLYSGSFTVNGGDDCVAIRIKD